MVFVGVHLTTFFMSGYFLLKDKTNASWKWLLFILVLFANGTANICFNVHFNEMAWIDQRNYPGGPLAFLNEQQALPINTAGNVNLVVSVILAQMLLVSSLRTPPNISIPIP